MTAKPGETQVNIIGHGLFIADTWRVASKLTDYTHSRMVNECLGLWPLLCDGDAKVTRKFFRSQPAYVLAVILCQK